MQQLQEASVLEQAMLAVSFPLRNPKEPVFALDARTPADTVLHHISVLDTRYSDRELIIDHFRPLFFLTAWKVLDLVMELALSLGGFTPKKDGIISINEKQKKAREGRGQYPLLSDDAEVWKRITFLDAETVEARHSLLHRKFKVDRSGSIVGIADRKGMPMLSLTATEQEALCRVAQMVIEIGISQRWNSRERAYLSWSLDRVARHHGQPALGGGAARPIQIVRI
ncbi:MAG: hypothetical protein R6V60_00145 [Desulfobacterales bacterium]